MAQDCIRTPYALNRPNGYGTVIVNGVHHNHQRVVYAETNGLAIADLKGKVVRHTCHNCWCINPAHLVLGTAQDNMTDKVQAGRWKGGQPRKLTDQQVQEIRAERRKTATELGIQYGVSRATINNVINYKSCYGK